MKYAIIGSGRIGTALARTFARKNIEVGIANSRGPETLTSLARELGSSVFPTESETREVHYLCVEQDRLVRAPLIPRCHFAMEEIQTALGDLRRLRSA
jgi:3-hydroxyisobutyrate dehydrogenase-like beta-hydroxyacid dehydrogenase